MDSTFGSLRDATTKEPFCSIFMDDANISTPAFEGDTDDDIFERHVAHVSDFLTRAKERNIQFKLMKSKFAVEEMSMLGFVVGNGQRKLQESKIQGLLDWPEPQTLADVISFRAYANFIREFLPAFQENDFHLKKYTKKGMKFSDYQRDEKAQEAFKRMKADLAKQAALHVIDYAAAADPKQLRPLELYVMLATLDGAVLWHSDHLRPRVRTVSWRRRARRDQLRSTPKAITKRSRRGQPSSASSADLRRAWQRWSIW